MPTITNLSSGVPMSVIRSKSVVLVAAVALVLVTAVGAFAYWTSDGGGEGTAEKRRAAPTPTIAPVMV